MLLAKPNQTKKQKPPIKELTGGEKKALSFIGMKAADKLGQNTQPGSELRISRGRRQMVLLFVMDDSCCISHTSKDWVLYYPKQTSTVRRRGGES